MGKSARMKRRRFWRNQLQVPYSLREKRSTPPGITEPSMEQSQAVIEPLDRFSKRWIKESRRRNLLRLRLHGSEIGDDRLCVSLTHSERHHWKSQWLAIRPDTRCQQFHHIRVV